MRGLRVPIGVWDWKGSALVLLLLLTPFLAALSLVPLDELIASASSARSLLVGSAMLSAGFFLYLHWRVTASRTSGWLGLLLAVAAIPGLALGAFSLTHPEVVEQQHGWVLVFRVVVMVALIVMVVASQRIPVPADPMAIGLLVGIAIAVLRQLLILQATPLPTPTPTRLLVGLLVGVLTLGLVVVLVRLHELAPWVRARFGVALTLLGIGSAIDGPVSLVTSPIGAVLLAGTAAAGFHQALDDEKRELEELHDQLHRVETGMREDRARLHEIDATVAGIASAQRLIHDGTASERSEALAAMMHAEVERLHRLMADSAPVRRRSVDLDDVVGQIVLAHRARGRAVTWEPSGARALARSDDVAEIVNVLLENAAVHGGPSGAWVTTDTDASEVVLTVSDRGPGVEPGLREDLFAWGAHRAGSPGQGIGLHVAAELASGLGGRLELLPTHAGASFALHLPLAPREVAAGAPVVRAS